MKLTRVSAVAAAFAVMVKLPAAATTRTVFMVVSLVATVATITLAVVTRGLGIYAFTGSRYPTEFTASIKAETQS